MNTDRHDQRNGNTGLLIGRKTNRKNVILREI